MSIRSKVRIIGGKWRSRQISFPEIPGLRPTQDRIRETLFNWLAPFITNAKCLDLFAGSGVLGFEALSRGASCSYFVEFNTQALTHLRNNAEKLKIPAVQFKIIRADFPRVPQLTEAPFNIVFLDPPFHSNLMQTAIDWLQHSQILQQNALIYMEMAKDTSLTLPTEWEIFRHRETRTLIYQLVHT